MGCNCGGSQARERREEARREKRAARETSGSNPASSMQGLYWQPPKRAAKTKAE